jgi:hypothetical protein
VEDAPDGIRQRRRRLAFIVCAVLLAVAVLAVCVVFGPVWLTGADLTATQRLTCVPQVRIGFVTRSGVSLQVTVAELVTGNQMP